MEKVIITDIQMKFWSMVWFMVKWALASIPAFIVLAFIGAMIFMFIIATQAALS